MRRRAKTLLVLILCNLLTCKMMYAQENFGCGTYERLLPSNHEEVTVLDPAKVNITHPCGSSGTVNLRVIVHFMLKSDGTGNFNEYNDGRTSDPLPSGAPSDYHYRWNGYRFAAELVYAANTIMIPNSTLERTSFSTCSPLSFPRPAVLDKRILYTLQGVYFHRNTTATVNDYNTYATDSYHSTFAVKKDSCIQIYLFPNTSGPSGYVHRVLGNDNNMACFIKNYWNGYNVSTGMHWENVVWSDEGAAHKILNHEIMHLLGVHHTNNTAPYRDFCEDTPDCSDKSGYNTIVNDGICSICQTILTPDQLERVYTTLNGGLLWTSGFATAKVYTNTSYATKYRYKCETCSPVGSPPYSFFHINKDGCGQVFIGGGWYGTWYTAASQYIEIFETNAIGGNTVVGNYYSGWRAVDELSFSRNLSSFYTFQHNKIYKIKMAVSTSCVSWQESSQWILYTNPTPCERVANSPEPQTTQAYPNPVTDKVTLTFSYPTQHIQIVDVLSKIVDTFIPDNPNFTEWQPKTDLPNGLYCIISDNRKNLPVKIIVQH